MKTDPTGDVTTSPGHGQDPFKVRALLVLAVGVLTMPALVGFALLYEPSRVERAMNVPAPMVESQVIQAAGGAQALIDSDAF